MTINKRRKMLIGSIEDENERKRVLLSWLTRVTSYAPARIIFSFLMIAIETFYELYNNCNEGRVHLKLEQTDENTIVKKEEFPDCLVDRIEQFLFVGILTQSLDIQKLNDDIYEIPGRKYIIYPQTPINSKQIIHDFNYSAQYLFDVLRIPRTTGNRGIDYLEVINEDLKRKKPMLDGEKEEFISIITIPLAKQEFLTRISIDSYRGTYIKVSSEILELLNRDIPADLLLKLRHYGTLEIDIYKKLKEIKTLENNISILYNRFEHDHIQESITAFRIRSGDFDEKFLTLGKEWDAKLEKKNLLIKLLRKMKTVCQNHLKDFNAYSIQHLDKLFDNIDKITEHFILKKELHINKELKKMKTPAKYQSLEMVIIESRDFLRNGISKEDNKNYDDLISYWHEISRTDREE